ncbi:MAG: M48 family metalloprotease, partial [Planctomycetes bacterium]|nr:M48 family metalloprotease [Planctomycetota bacterium]
MKLAAYDALIERLERLALASPTSYRTRVALLAAFGYLMVGLALLIGLALLATAAGVLFLGGKAVHGAAVFKIAFVLAALGGALAWSVLRGVWLRFPRVDGIALVRTEAPDLFAEVENLRRAVGSPPVHRIVITPEFNAALAQRPRLGLFGWYENQLVLGLPLLRRMDVAQARSVIAHELGHLRGEHGRFGAWIHRLR